MRKIKQWIREWLEIENIPNDVRSVLMQIQTSGAELNHREREFALKHVYILNQFEDIKAIMKAESDLFRFNFERLQNVTHNDTALNHVHILNKFAVKRCSEKGASHGKKAKRK